MNQYGNLNKITAASLEKYLMFNDWVRNYEFPNRNLMYFANGEEIIVFPSSEKLSDFYIVLPKTIEILADIYGKTPNDIVKDIICSYFDRIEFRIKSQFAEKGELPMGYASQCIEGLRELILYSACAEQNTEPICVKTTKNAKKILNNFKLGQTDVGSFVINIDIQVVNDVNEQFDIAGSESNVLIEHKVVKRIGNALRQIDDVANDKVKLDDILPKAYQKGVTANICDALLKLKPEKEDAEINAKIRYASSITRKVGDTESVDIKGCHFYVMQEISNRYKIVELSDTVRIKGSIALLKKIKESEENYKREIVIATFAEGTYRSIKAELVDADYKIACDAHRDGFEVEVSGKLDMGVKNWKFSQVDSFRVLKF